MTTPEFSLGGEEDRRSVGPLVGSPVPRLGTPPLRDLTPDTTDGFALIDFAKRVGQPLLPWQETAAIRALELSEDPARDGRYRFRQVLIMVGRQSGKTTLLKMWALWRMCGTPGTTVLGVAQQLRTAQESWRGAVDIAEGMGLANGRSAVRRANGEQCLTIEGGSRYLISAATRGAGRGFSIDLLVMDELREQRTDDAYAALTPTILARPDGQAVYITNAGDDESVVLNSIRATALSGVDPSVGLFEWSAPEGCDLMDPEAWCWSVPALGHTVKEHHLRRAIMSATSPEMARTEYLCQHVSSLASALDPNGWARGADPNGSIAPYRGRLVAGIDVSLDGNHVALVAAAALDDGRVRVEPLASWDSTLEARRELPGLLDRLGPVHLCWFPGGPANALAPVLSGAAGERAITGLDVTAACMGFADLVDSGMVLHNADALLDGQVARAARLEQGDGFRFTRRGSGNCNALYAAAGAVHVARTMKAPRRKVFVA